jgi:MSHA biogenesis protein MshI
MFGRRKQKASTQCLVGLSLTEQGLALAKVEQCDAAGCRLQQLAYAPCGSIDDIAATLQQWVSDYKLKGEPVNFVLGAHMFSLILTDAPDVKPEELTAAMRWKAKDLIQFDLSDAIVDIFAIPGQKERGRQPMAYVVCAATDVLRAYVEVIQKNHLNIRAIDIPPLVQRNIAHLLPEDTQGVALISLSERGGAISICRQGELYLTRDLDVGWQHFEASASQPSDSLGLTEAMPPANSRALNAIILEVQRSLDYYESHFAQPAIKNLVIAPMPRRIEGMIDYLSSNTGLMVREIDMNVVMTCEQHLEQALQSHCLPAIGAALRNAQAA